MSKNSIRDSYTEFGSLETLSVLRKYIKDYGIISESCKSIPIPLENDFSDICSIKTGLEELGKKRLLFLTPEIAVLEKFTNDSPIKEVIICLPSDTEDETAERIYSNMPSSIKVSFIREHEIGFLRPFRPDNAAIVVFGFCDDENALIPDYNYRMMEYYNLFYGKKVLVSCGSNVSNERPAGWIPVKAYEFFTDVI